MKVQQIHEELRRQAKEKSSKYYKFGDDDIETLSIPSLFVNGNVLEYIFNFYDEHRFANQLKNKLESLNSSISIHININIQKTFGYREFTPFLILKIKDVYTIIIDSNFLINPFRFNKDSIDMPIRERRVSGQMSVAHKRKLLENLHMVDDSLTSVFVCIEHIMMWVMIILYDHILDNFQTHNQLMKCMMKECFDFSSEEELIYFSMNEDNVFLLYDLSNRYEGDDIKDKLFKEPRLFIIVS